jgi:hypothetical protein
LLVFFDIAFFDITFFNIRLIPLIRRVDRVFFIIESGLRDPIIFSLNLPLLLTLSKPREKVLIREKVELGPLDT